MAEAQRWILRKGIPRTLPRQYDGLDPLLAKILYARKMETAEEIRAFLDAGAPLGDPFSMRGMRTAVARLVWAIEKGEPIVVYGDYDADGVTANALLVSALRTLGADVSPYIPDRFGESYGLNDEALDELHARGARIVVTVDCGIRAVKEAAHAAELGLELIITDHHSVPATLPTALAVIDPKQPDCEYPFKELAGVGVAHRLAEALYTVWNAMHPDSQPLDAGQYLDLVAVGTVADIVPLVGENRSLARRGLEALRASPRPGLLALMEAAGVRPEAVDSQAIAFRLGPRLNAAGRMEEEQGADLSFRLLMSEDPDEARHLAADLNQLNEKRQALLDRQVARALEEIGDVGHRKLLFVAGEDYHEGIVGLIASRLAEMYYLPTLVMRAADGKVRGSARSIEGYHITQALETCHDLLERYGGHAQAAGFTLDPQQIEAFRDRIEAHAEARLTDSPLLERRLEVDAIVGLGELTLEAVRALAELEPCGEGNPSPSLATLGLRVLKARVVGSDGKHLRLRLGDGRDAITAIAFRMGHLAEEHPPGGQVDVVYTPSVNEYNGSTSVQMVVQALRPVHERPQG